MAISISFANGPRITAADNVANSGALPGPITVESALDTVAPGGTITVTAAGGTPVSMTYVGTGADGGIEVTFGAFTYYLTDSTLVVGTAQPTVSAVDLVCFAAGTLIATVNGDVKVEDLRAGDLLVTASGATTAVKWLGVQTRSTVFSDAAHVCPIRISAGALAAGVPARDLLVTGDHGLVFDEAIVHASALVNGTTITRVAKADLGATVTYYHVETEGHAVILAEGAPAETFIDNAGREKFDNFAEFVAMYGPEQDDIEPLTIPRAKSAREVPAAIKARIAARVAEIADDLAAAV